MHWRHDIIPKRKTNSRLLQSAVIASSTEIMEPFIKTLVKKGYETRKS